MEPLLTLEEAARITRLKSATLYVYAGMNKIPHIKIGSRLLFDPVRLREWIASKAVPCGDEGLMNLMLFHQSILKREGRQEIYEYRIDFGGNINRILEFFHTGDFVVLTNGFMKKTKKTPAE